MYKRWAEERGKESSAMIPRSQPHGQQKPASVSNIQYNKESCQHPGNNQNDVDVADIISQLWYNIQCGDNEKVKELLTPTPSADTIHCIEKQYMSHSHDPVLHCVEKQKEYLAIYLVNLGFTCDHVYKQTCFVPCGACYFCAYDEEDFCQHGRTQTVNLSVEYLAKQYNYKELLKLIKKV